MGVRRIHFTDDDIQNMTELRNSGMSYEKIGSKYGVSKEVIINRLGRDKGTSKYLKEKLKVLRELYVEITDEEFDYLKSLKTESDIDHYAHRLIMKDIFAK